MKQTDLYDHLPDLDMLADYAATLAGSAQQLADRVSEDEVSGALRWTVSVATLTAEVQRTAVAILRHDGHSWSAIAACLGVSPQAAQQRFSRAEADASR